MGDQQDPTRRRDKSKRKAGEYEDGVSSAVRRRVVREVSGQSGGGDGIPGPGIPSQPQAAPLLVRQQHGGSSVLQLQAPALGGSQLQPSRSGASTATGATGPLPIRAAGQNARPPFAPAVNQPPVHLMGQPPPPLLPAYQMPGHQWMIREAYGAATVARPLQIQGNPGQNAGNNQPQAQPISLKAMEWGQRMAARTGKLQFRDDTGQKAGGSRAAVPSSMDLPPPQPRHQHPSSPVGHGQRGVAAATQIGQPSLLQPGPGQQARPVLPTDPPVGLRRQTAEQDAPPAFQNQETQVRAFREVVPPTMDPPPPPVGAGVQLLPYQLAVGNHPVGQHGEAPGAGGDAAQLEHPVLPADQPGPGPNN